MDIISEALFDKQKAIILASTQREFNLQKELEDIDNIFLLTVAKLKIK